MSIISIEIKPDATIIYLGDTISFTALATYDSGEVVDITSLAEWNISGSPTIAEFSDDENGLLISSAVGSATIHALYGDISDTTTVTIHNPLIIQSHYERLNAYEPMPNEYLALITSQYQNSPKFLAWVNGFLEMMQDIQELAANLTNYFSFNSIVENTELFLHDQYLTIKDGEYDFNYFNFEACVGNQLDIVGELLGQARKVDFNPSDGSSPVLEDDDYRTLLKNKVLWNRWDGKAETMPDYWKQVFPGGKIIVQDNQNMTIDILLYGAFTPIIIDLITNDYIVPRPQGVLINYQYGTMPYFGFDRDDAYVSGFDVGNFT